MRWGVVLVACAGMFFELGLVYLVTAHSMATAPLGFNNSGEAGPAIAVLGFVQFGLVGALALPLSRLVPELGHEGALPRQQRCVWSGLLSSVGMTATCVALAVWSLKDGTVLVVDTSVIAGKSTVTNVGAWWPGLFAAMVALTVVAVAGVPGVIWRLKRARRPVASPLHAESFFLADLETRR